MRYTQIYADDVCVLEKKKAIESFGKAFLML